MPKRKIVVAGSILVDRINEVDAYPGLGELTQIRALSRVSGGLVPNTGMDVHILAPDIPVAAFGKVGRDEDGDFVVSVLEKAGLDVSGIVRSEKPTSFTNVVSVRGGERTFFTYPGASADWGYDDFPFEKVSPGDIVLLGYFLLLDRIDAGEGEKILKKLKEIGAMTAIDLVSENSDRYSLVRKCLPYVDYLIVNETEAQRIAGVGGDTQDRETCEALMRLGVREKVIIHRPERGVLLQKGGVFAQRPCVKIPEGFIKGKTGAGDAYCAGALTAIFRGLSPDETLTCGAVAAVGALSAPGATEGMKTMDELKAVCESL
jgi:sugar/nucleoside kinase (ribokinase family)